jgi:hypothetical protein
MTNKSPALVKIEALAQVGNRLENLPRMIAFAKSAIDNGIPANESQNTPALTALEVRSVLSEDTITLITLLPSS